METLDEFSNTELLARLAGKPAAAVLLQRYGRLRSLAQASFDELKITQGVGRSRAAAIRAAFLLAQRLAREIPPDPPLMDTPERVADLLREENRPYTVEHFQVLFLNTRRRLIRVEKLSQGTLDTLLIHARVLLVA